ncbi:YceI family protein [Aquimarina sp. MMG016]|uniref:YceI family protein n=1 Tax=Aquimarina sp. MMG016 TaxID=2822690 RepID=UPI001B3A6F32|nr:YceI family protein [Aquimarina sp. MMG016]
MKNIKTIFIAFSILIGLQALYSQDYTLNPKKSLLTWTGKAAFNSYSLTGTIQSEKGTLSIDENVISDLKIMIDMKSLDHENKDLKKHLRSKDFFEVKTYPTSEFLIQDSSIPANNTTTLSGMLTIKNKTNNEKIPVTIQQSKSEVIITFEYSIDRTKYGINHNSPSIFKRLKENAIADDFILKGKLVFNP